MNQRALLVLASLILASCGGGGHAATAVPAASSGGPTQNGSLSLTFATPATTSATTTAPATATSAAERKPKFVSPNATSALVSINSGTDQTFNVGPTSSLCTTANNVRTCSIPLTAPIGNDAIAVSLMGTVNSNAVLLGQGSNSLTVVDGTNFNLTVGINPVVASVNTTGSNPDVACCFTFGQANSQFSTITFADASGANITGSGNVPNFLAPITLTSSDPTFTTSPTTLTTPGQGFLVNYSGSTNVAQTVTITASVGALTLATETFQLPGLFITRYNLGAIDAINPEQIAEDQSGNVWVAENVTNMIAQITPAGTITTFPTGIAGGHPVGIAVGQDGNIYYDDVSSCTLGRMTATGALDGTASAAAGGCQDWQMTTDAAGNIWFVDSGNNTIGYIGEAGWPTTATECTGALPALAFSIHQQITQGPDGAMWFTEGGNGHKIGRYASTAACNSGTVTQYQPPSATNSNDLGGLVVGADNNLWFTEFTADQYAKITTAGVITEYSGLINPAAFANPIWLAPASSNGDLYLVQGGGAINWNPSTPATAFQQPFVDSNGQEGQTDMHSAIYVPAAAGPGAIWFSGYGSTGCCGFINTQDEVAKFVPR